MIDGTPAVAFFGRQWVLSNHHPAEFVMNFEGQGPIVCNCSEQGYFLTKALNFGDLNSFNLIRMEQNPGKKGGKR